MPCRSDTRHTRADAHAGRYTHGDSTSFRDEHEDFSCSPPRHHARTPRRRAAFFARLQAEADRQQRDDGDCDGYRHFPASNL